MQRNLRNFNGLFTFYVVATSGPSMKVAAEVLDVSVPTISECIKKLNAALGVRVIVTRTKKTVVTPEGQMLLERLTPAFVILEEYFVEVGNMHPRLITERKSDVPDQAPGSLPESERCDQLVPGRGAAGSP